MENPEIENQAALENFRSQIQKLKEQEWAKKVAGSEDYEPHLVHIDTAELTVDDKMMYDLVASLENKDPAEFTAGDEKELNLWLKAYAQGITESGDASRDNFRQYLINKKAVDLSLAIQKAVLRKNRK